MSSLVSVLEKSQSLDVNLYKSGSWKKRFSVNIMATFVGLRFIVSHTRGVSHYTSFPPGHAALQ